MIAFVRGRPGAHGRSVVVCRAVLWCVVLCCAVVLCCVVLCCAVLYDLQNELKHKPTKWQARSKANAIQVPLMFVIVQCLGLKSIARRLCLML